MTNKNIASIITLIIVLSGYFIPAYYRLIMEVWSKTENEYQYFVFAIVMYMFYSQTKLIENKKVKSESDYTQYFLLLFSMWIYIIGESQNIDFLVIFSQMLLLVVMAKTIGGVYLLKLYSLPIFSMLFLVPIPGVFIYYLTHELKYFVSFASTNLLYVMNYPISRDGVTIYIGDYQLLVADACSGMNSIISMFTLGILFLYVAKVRSLFKNVILVLLIVPIAVLANIVRVIILILITYHIGDEYAQGFIHTFAGVILYFVALVIFYTCYYLLTNTRKENDSV